MGGAQGNTLFTVSHLDQKVFEPLLISGIGGLLDDEAAKMQKVRTIYLSEMVREIAPLKDLLCFFKLRHILRKEKPDIVHSHSSKAGILGAGPPGAPVCR